jgi:hypothetical protein
MRGAIGRPVLYNPQPQRELINVPVTDQTQNYHTGYKHNRQHAETNSYTPNTEVKHSFHYCCIIIQNCYAQASPSQILRSVWSYVTEYGTVYTSEVPESNGLVQCSCILLKLLWTLHINIFVIHTLLPSHLITNHLNLFLLHFHTFLYPIPFLFTFDHIYSCFLPVHFIHASCYLPNTKKRQSYHSWMYCFPRSIF